MNPASITPLQPISAALGFIQIPSVTAKYFTPGNGLNGNNFTIYSFSTNYEVNYTLDVYAYYDPITHEGIFQPVSAYLLPNGSWIVAAYASNPLGFEPFTIMVGTGDNASSLIWHSIGLMNATGTWPQVSVAGNGTAIRVAYFETNATGFGADDPKKWVKYFASEDYGETWTNGTIWDISTLEEDWCTGITLTAYQNTFECMWGFANCSDENYDRYNLTTVWESRDQGAGWSQAKNLTALEGKHAYRPQAFYNQSNGCLYVAVNNFTESLGAGEVIVELGAGPENPATDSWSISPAVSLTDNTLVYCALDYDNQNFYFGNNTELIAEAGIRNASNWKGTIGNLDHFPIDADERNFNLFAKNGPKLFCGEVTNVYGLNRGGLLDCEAPFFLQRLTGTLAPAEVMMHIFNGTDSSGSTHNASAYLLSLLVERDGDMPITSELVVSVDRRIPKLSVSHGNPVISPLTSVGNSDVFSVSINATKHGTGDLTIDAIDQQVNGSVDVTDGLYSYERPVLCGDGRVNYLFYEQKEGNLNKLMVTRTDTAGISWSTPKVVRTFQGTIYRVVASYKGGLIYVWVQAAENGIPLNLLFISSDEGNSFIPVELPAPVDDVTNDLVCWNFYYDYGLPDFYIFRSNDFGHTWSLFLTIPQNGHDYNHLGAVARDPVSGNYSFLVTNNSRNGVKLVTTTKLGDALTEWECLAEGAQGLVIYPTRLYNLDNRWTSSGETEWIITTNNYGAYWMSNWSTNVAYRTTRGDGIFSPWQNFTGISGEIIPVTVSQPTWSILFPENATPCVATCIPDVTLVQSLKQVRVFYGTSFVYATSAVVPAGTTARLDFFGVSNAGQPLPEGEYNWVVTFTDLAGQITTEKGILEIDNTAPNLGDYGNITTPYLPDPRYFMTVTVPVRDLHISTGILRYRTTPAGFWTPIPMTLILTGLTTANFTAVIPILGDVTVYWEVVINDSAGNTLVVNNAGQSFTYARANLRLEEEHEPPAILDLSGGATLEVQIVVPEDKEYMDHVYIQYHFDDGKGWQMAMLAASGESMYNYTFSDFPENVSLLEYTVIGVDIYGNQITLGRTRIISLLPALPAWEMTSMEQAVVLLISLVVGVVCGVVYSSMIRQRTGGRILTKEMVASVVQDSRELGSREVQYNAGKKSPVKIEKSSIVALVLGLAGGGVGVGGAVIFILIYQWPEAAMLCITGTMLAMVFLWILTTNSAVRRTLRANKPKISVGKIVGIFLVGLTIFASVLVLLFIGNMVAWWHVRVNEQAYNVFGLEIPQMITTLASTFFSSIILLTWSVSKDVSKTYLELQDAELNNENPGRIIALREARIANILGAVGWKGVLFIAIIGSTLIFASDLSVYAPQGLIIIIPFVVGTVVMLAVNSFRKYKTGIKSGLAPMFFDRVSKCPACGAETPVGGAFCENCGAKIITGERVKEGQECPACHQPTTSGVKHCRYCGNALNPAS